MNKKFKISPELKPYIRQLMARSEYHFRIKTEGDQLYLITNISGTKFHNIVQRAKCMKLSEETGIMHVTKRESENSALVMSLQNEYHANSFVISGTSINKDTATD